MVRVEILEILLEVGRILLLALGASDGAPDGTPLTLGKHDGALTGRRDGRPLTLGAALGTAAGIADGRPLALGA